LVQRSIVLIEDDETQASATTAALESAGARVTWFSDPPDVQDLLEPKPDLIVLDCILSTMSGPDYLRMLRGRAGLQNLPVIVTTGFPELAKQMRELEGPQLALLPKPYDRQSLVATMDRLLQARAA